MSRRPGALVAFIGVSLAALLQASWMLAQSPPKSFSDRPRGAPQRVVIFPPILWAYATLEEGVDHVVGIAAFLARDAHDGLLDTIYPRLDSVSVVATRGALTAIPANPEELLALHPDMVVTWKWFAAPLRAVGLPVLELTVDRKSERASMLQQWHTLAVAIGRVPQETRLVAAYRQALSAISRDVAGAKPSALVISRSSVGTLLSDAREVLAVAGATRPARVPLAGRLSDEELLRINPDFLFLRCCAGVEDTPAALYADERFAPLEAVRHRRVYLEPSGSFHMEGLVEEPLLDRWMAELLRPKDASRFREALAAAYKDQYSFIVSYNQLAYIIHYDSNKLSENYRRFE